MKIPPGKTEEDVTRAINKAVNILARRFSFGIYEHEDIKQQGWLMALQVLEEEKYDHTRPLENFIYTHIRNRLSNLKRDKFSRTDAPCKQCHEGNPCGDDGDFCERYRTWHKRNQDKANIAKPLDLTHVAFDKERKRTGFDDVETQELFEKIRDKLPLELQRPFLEMRDGVSVPKAKRQQVEQAVREILCHEKDD